VGNVYHQQVIWLTDQEYEILGTNDSPYSYQCVHTPWLLGRYANNRQELFDLISVVIPNIVFIV
jgi:hypothetical protein